MGAIERYWRIAAVLLLSAAAAGCITLTVSVKDIEAPVSLTGLPDTSYTVVTHFSMEQDHSFLFLKRLAGAGHPDFPAMIRRQLKATPGDAIINLKIVGDTKAGDLMLPIVVGIGGSFITPFFLVFTAQPLFADLKSYTIEGDVIRYRRSAPVPSPVVFDPETGLPVTPSAPVEFDPETGLPKK